MTERTGEGGSFSREVKREITGREIKAPCCVQAACYGIACFGRYFDARGVVLHSENAFISQWAKAQFAAAGVAGKVYKKGAETSPTYEFAIKDPFEVEKILAMFGHTGEETTLRIHSENLECESCLAGFTAAAFLCCGTIVNPEKGYSLEFVTPKYSMLKDFQGLLAARGFSLKHTTRKGSNVLYTKSSTQIEDLLTFMGATNAALEIMNLKVYKDFRNKANRITNCETANIDKTVAATRQVLNAIDTLEKHGALSALPDNLQKAAALRRQYPDYSLAELAEVSEEPVSKSGLSHRYKKLCGLAQELKLAR